MSVFTSRPLTVSWAYPSQVAVNGPANLNDPAVKCGAGCAVGCVGNRRPGWWVLNICQTAAPACGVPEQAAPAEAMATPGELLRSDANALLTSTVPGAMANGELPVNRKGRCV